MPIQRHFLGLERPALHTAANYLLDKHRDGETADLRNVVVVLPGSRAGRRLLEILVAESEEQDLLLTPPIIETVGHLPEQLYNPQRPFANELAQRFAWAHALRATPASQLQPVIPNPPDAVEETRWMELGDAFRKQHVELAADGLDFRAVAERGAQLRGFDEAARWQAMAKVQDEYHRTLDEADLWDLQTARLVAIRQRECRTEQDIVLIGTVDMNSATRQMLDQVAEQVTALIPAPREWSDRFDAHGCLLADKWRDATIPIATEQVNVVDGPNDQAHTVLRCLADYDHKYAADEITIGIPDEHLLPDVSRVLAGRGVNTRWGPGRSLAESGPFRLMSGVADCVGRSNFRSFANLVRHPAIESWLGRQRISGDWLTELDNYHSEHLPHRLSNRWLGPTKNSVNLQAVFRAIQSLISPLDGADRSAERWCDAIQALLVEVYGHEPLDRENDRATIASLEAMGDALASFSGIPKPLSPRVSASQAISLALDQVAKRHSPAPADPDAIELLGWLELPLDDAPAVIVTSLNEGFVPESVNSDLFLPNRLRCELGLLDNARRYARDAYALSVMQRSRQDLQIIVGRRDHANDPLIPSRLLFATDSETVAQRALLFFQRPAAAPPQPGSGVERPSGNELGSVPRPEPLDEPVTSMSVTSFRDYIACPYRFYLRHVLRLRIPDDHSDELDGAAFGSLAHEVLRQFGACPERDATDPAQIRRVLHDALNRCVAKTYGRDAMAVVHVQVELLRLRLDAFAEKQAEWASGGWRIEHTEVPTNDHQDATIDIADQPMRLTGRIDRIDVNVETGERVLFDYKTSEAARRPREAHERGGAWVDLQLPLYRHLVSGLGIEGPLELGYILLPKDPNRIEYCFGKWTDEELADADELAREIAQAVRNEKFWPPTEPAPDFSEEFAAICRDQVLRR
jgi:hypothetical protein